MLEAFPSSGLRAALVLAVGLAAACSPAAPAGDDGPALPADAERLTAEVRPIVQQHARRVRESPTDGERHGALGLVYEANGLWPEAREAFEKASRLAPDDPVWPAHLAAVLQVLGEDAGALELLGAAAARLPASAPLHHRLGIAALDAGRFEQAGEAFRHTVELAPGEPDGYLGLAAVHVEQGDAVGAIETLERALELRPASRVGHYLLGLALRAQGRHEEARRELERGIGGRLRPMADEGTAKLARFAVGTEHNKVQARKLLATGRVEEAASILEELQERDPEDLRVALDLGAAYSRLGRAGEAHAVLLEAEQLDASSATVQASLAACELELGRPAEALSRAERAAVLAPDLVQAELLRARALSAIGRAAEAGAALDRAERLSEGDPGARSAVAEARAALEAARPP